MAMPLYLVTAPTEQPVSLADAKAFMRVDTSDDDDVISAMLNTAIQNVDGRDGRLGRALISQTWDLKLPGFCGYEIGIPLPPLIEVASVTYYDGANALQTLSTDVYEVAGIGGFAKGRVVLKYGQRWPVTYERAEAITIRFRAGYVDTDASPATGEVPAPILTAIKRQVATMYENRESVVVGATVATIPGAVESMLAPYRVW